MLRKIDHTNMGGSNLGWLQSLYHFSFADYFNNKSLLTMIDATKMLVSACVIYSSCVKTKEVMNKDMVKPMATNKLKPIPHIQTVHLHTQKNKQKLALQNEMQDKFFVGGIRWVRFHLFYGSTTMGN